MTYDDWKTESPEDERERLARTAAHLLAKFEWMEEHEDMLREEKEERRRWDKEHDDE